MRTWITRLVVTIAAGALLAGAVAGGAGAAVSKKSPAAHRSYTPNQARKAAAPPSKVQSTSDDGKPSVSSRGCEPGDDLSSSNPDVHGSGGDAPAPPTSCD